VAGRKSADDRDEAPTLSAELGADNAHAAKRV
jgi:hypothetical protein